MAKGKKSGGRKQGTPNKLSKTVKENIEAVFENLGGITNMLTWASSNSTEFYRLYAKLLPTDPVVDVNNTAMVVNIVRAFPDNNASK